jgi:hypothetical protein
LTIQVNIVIIVYKEQRKGNRKLSDSETVYIRGEANWAKIVGPPRLNKFTDEKEWAIDVTPDKDSRLKLRKLGISDRLREPKEGDKREETFFSFKQRELRKDGTKNDPIRIVDANGDDWNGALIGNGSTVDVKFVVKDYGKGKKKGVYIRAVRVLDLVPYEIKEFAPLSSDDEFFGGEAEPEAEPEKEVKTSKKKSKFEVEEGELDDDFPV